MIRIVALGAIAIVLASAAAAQQQASSLKGHWSGVIDEPGGSVPKYTLAVDFNVDGQGRLVGSVDYGAFPCSGVWSNARQGAADILTLDETITANAGNCAEHVVIELKPMGASLGVRLWPAELPSRISTGALQKR